MPHRNSVLVVHPNGETYAQRERVEPLIARGRAYWTDKSKTKAVIRPGNSDEPISGREYGGALSYMGYLTAAACDLRTRTIVHVPIEECDRTGIPIRVPGGAKVLQLKRLKNRRSNGRHITIEDKLWRPARSRRNRKNPPGPQTVAP